MIYARKLYTGRRAAGKAREIRWKLDHNAGMVDTYVVALADSPGDLLDIYPSHVLMQRYFRENSPCIVGLAIGKREAIDVVKRLILDCQRGRGDLDIGGFIESP